MGKTIAITGKFTEAESDRIDSYAKIKGISKSAALHELVMNGFNQPSGETKTVTFRFKENFSFFWKDHDYIGFIEEGNAHIKFGGEWKIYKVDEIPADIIGG